MGAPCRREPTVCRRRGREDLAADPVRAMMTCGFAVLANKYENTYRRSDDV